MASFFPNGQDAWTTKVDNVTTVLASHVNDLQNAVASLETGGVSIQNIAYAASITPDVPAGELVSVGTLTGNITINNATNPLTGRKLIFQFTQDSTGNRSVTWGSAYLATNWTVNLTANRQTQAVFVYDGSHWIMAQSPPTVASAALSGKQIDKGGFYYTVMAYSAKLDGVTNDNAAWAAAITDVSANNPSGNPGGIVLMGPGVSIINAQIAETVANITVQGAGSYASVIKRADSSAAHMFHLTAAAGARFLDIGLDLNGTTNNVTATCAGIWMDTASNNVVVDRCRLFNCDGFSVFVGGGPTSRNNNLRILNSEIVQVAGGTHDLCVPVSNTGVVSGCRFQVTNAQAGLNLYESFDMVVAGNMFQSPGGGGNALCVISSCQATTITGNTFVGGDADVAINVICEQDNANNQNAIDTVISANTARGVATGNSKFVRLAGGGHANKSVLNTQVVGNIVDTWQWFIFYQSGTITGVGAADNRLVNVSNTVGYNVTPTDIWYHHNPGWNPQGSITIGAAAGNFPAVAGSTTNVVNSSGFDVWLVIATGGGVTVSAINLGGVVTGHTMPVSSSLGVRVPAKQQISLTYAGGTPTWTAFGD